MGYARQPDNSRCGERKKSSGIPHKDHPPGASSGPNARWSGLAPLPLLFIAAFIAFLSSALVVRLAMQQPWLGVVLAPHPDGLLVTRLDPAGPSASVLRAGAVLTAVRERDGSWLPLRGEDLKEDPDEYRSFAQYNAFLARQDRLHRILRASSVEFRLKGGPAVRITPSHTTPLHALSMDLWTGQGFAFLTLLISAAIWSLKQRSPATRLTLLSGIGLFLGALTASAYLGRELALDGALFRSLSLSNCAGNRLFAVSGLALLAIYPRKVVPVPLLWTLAGAEVLYVGNQIAQWFEPPLHAFYADYMMLATLACFISGRSWLAVRADPVERAVLKALLLPILLSVFLVMAIFVLPVVIEERPVIPVSASYMLLLVMYSGLALGVARFRLFNIDRWWIRIWWWFLTGLAILGIDVLLVAFLHWDPRVTLAGMLVLISWVYFPFRQWLWQRLMKKRSISWERHLADLVAHFVRSGSEQEDAEFWKRFLDGVFRPVFIAEVPGRYGSAELGNDGATLRVPTFVEGKALELRLPERGSRLFNDEDLHAARALFELASQARAHRKAYRLGVNSERRRIMRDLHDDVGGRLLSLIHSAEGERERQLAREALDSLREVIHFSLDAGREHALEELLGRWRAQTRKRLEQCNARLVWEWDESCETVRIGAREALNLSRILYECLSNALRHARPERVEIHGTVADDWLRIEISNDGVCEEEETGSSHGWGIHNIVQRMEEMGGEARCTQEGDTFRVHLALPLGKKHARDPGTGRS